jgi:hypothetical protein
MAKGVLEANYILCENILRETERLKLVLKSKTK